MSTESASLTCRGRPFQTYGTIVILQITSFLSVLWRPVAHVSVLSITQVRGLDEESEATLLTALTEILDNVDDVENLSPFDTLPDSDLLSGQKARELSPVSCQLLLRTPTTTQPPAEQSAHSAQSCCCWGRPPVCLVN